MHSLTTTLDIFPVFLDISVPDISKLIVADQSIYLEIPVFDMNFGFEISRVDFFASLHIELRVLCEEMQNNQLALSIRSLLLEELSPMIENYTSRMREQIVFFMGSCIRCKN